MDLCEEDNNKELLYEVEIFLFSMNKFGFDACV